VKSQLLFLVPGIAAVLIGLACISFGSGWSAQAYELLFGFDLVNSIDRFMPYFPFVPFYPVLTVMLGAYLIVKSRVVSGR